MANIKRASAWQMLLAFLFISHYVLHTETVVENTLSQAEILGSDLKKLIVCEELKALLKAELLRGNKAECFIRA